MNTSKPNQLLVKSVPEIFQHQFIIPSPRGGYRWTNTQVRQLLDDIWGFSKRRDKRQGEFYSLNQIIVTKCKETNRYKIINGHQRILTIFLILKYLEKFLTLAFPSFSFSAPYYETRPHYFEFLNSIHLITEEESKLHKDNIQIWNSFQCIKDWFKSKEEQINICDFTNTLLKTQPTFRDNITNNVRFIWYEIEEAEVNNSIDISINLKVGKNPLSNTELIKTLFLIKNNISIEKASLDQIHIASELVERENILN